MKRAMVTGVVLVALGCVSFLVVQGNRTEAASSRPMDSSVPGSEMKTPTEPDTPVARAGSAEADESDRAVEGAAQTAIKKAAGANKYLFLFVSENDSEETATAKRAFEAAANKLGDTVESAFINRNDAAEKGVIEKFELDRAPMPIVLALAPSGVITGAHFGEKLKDPQLRDSIASACEQRCLKALQERKLVFLCAQNGSTKSNDAAMQGVDDFKADTRFAQFTEVVKIDPSAAAEQGFLSKLNMDPKMNEATTAFLAPPGVLITQVAGATSKDPLVMALQAASSGGCGPGGGGPKGCCPQK